ncbi:MAG: hypothetical protein R3A79_19495 [Nannocystaceae bacterium]
MNTHFTISYDNREYQITPTGEPVTDGRFKIALESSDGGEAVEVSASTADTSNVTLTEDSAELTPSASGSSGALYIAADDVAASLVITVAGRSFTFAPVNWRLTYNVVTIDGAGITAPLAPSPSHAYVLVGSTGTLYVDAAAPPAVSYSGDGDGDYTTLPTQSTASPYAFTLPQGAVAVQITDATGATSEPFPVYWMSGSAALLCVNQAAPFAVPAVVSLDGAGAITVTLDPAVAALWFAGGSATPYEFSQQIAPDPSQQPWVLHFAVDDDDPKILIKRPPPVQG